NPVEEFIDTTLKEVLVVPDTKPSGPVHTTKPTALSAMEIGASSDVIPESMLETRYVVNSKTNEEATIENFLGRSALWANIQMDEGFKTWKINFQENAQVRKKLEMFTYVRFDLEITIVTNNTGLMQIMFTPPGIEAPKTIDGKEWDTASNPSVFYQPKSGFPRFTIPFTGLGSAYYMFYDGYDQTVSNGNTYGITTTNDMGTLCFRALDDIKNNDVKVFAKPKHTHAWIPRPPRATEYTHKNSTNYNRKVRDDSHDLEKTHFIKTRNSIKTAGP
ncbi:polyprotein, partial [Rhinovirus C]